MIGRHASLVLVEFTVVLLIKLIQYKIEKKDWLNRIDMNVCYFIFRFCRMRGAPRSVNVKSHLK